MLDVAGREGSTAQAGAGLRALPAPLYFPAGYKQGSFTLQNPAEKRNERLEIRELMASLPSVGGFGSHLHFHSYTPIHPSIHPTGTSGEEA